MQLGDIIRSFSEEAAASEALLACNDIVLFARVGDVANRYEETVGEYASGAVRRFAYPTRRIPRCQQRTGALRQRCSAPRILVVPAKAQGEQVLVAREHHWHGGAR